MKSFVLIMTLLALAGCKTEQSTADGQAAPPEGTLSPGQSTSGRPLAVTPRAVMTMAGVVLPAVPEVEPNDKSVEAMSLDKPCAVNALLEPFDKKKGRGTDWYKIVTLGKKLVAFEVSAIPGENVRVVVSDGDRNEIFTLDARGVGEAEFYPNLVVAGAAYLKVEGAQNGKGGPYKLSVRTADLQADEEIEYNGRYSLATEVPVGQPVRGILAEPTDEDWYLIKLEGLQTGSVLRINLTGVEGVRFELEATDQEERRPLLKAAAAKPGDGLSVRNMGLPEGAKAVYLTIRSAWVAGKTKKTDKTFNAEQQYLLTASSEAGGDNLEREPNEDAQHAQALLDGQKIKGYLSDPNDVDWYKIEVEKQSLLALELSGLNRVDLELQVIEPEKKDALKGAELMRINDGAVAEPEVLTNCALQPGTNYIRIVGALKNIDGKWTREAFNPDDTYELIPTLRTDDGREEREPNNDVEHATPIAVGETKRGTIHPKGDADFYKLDLASQSGPITTEIECTGIPKVNLNLKLLGPEMDDRNNHKVIETASKGKGEETERINQELMPGEYWIVVSGPKGSESNTKDQYVLSIKQ